MLYYTHKDQTRQATGREGKKLIKVPRMYQDNIKEVAFENAVDCLIYGYGKKYWDNQELDKQTSESIWATAKTFLAEYEPF